MEDEELRLRSSQRHYVRRLIRDGKKFNAIKYVINVTQAGIRVSKEYVDQEEVKIKLKAESKKKMN